MNKAYDLHSWSKHYRAQVMDAARRRDLIERARWETHGLRRLDLTWRNALTPLLRRTRTAGELIMSHPRDAASLIWPGGHWHYSLVGGGGRIGKTGPTFSARQHARRRSSALPDGRPMRKTVGGQDGGSGVDQMRMALYGKSWSLSCWRTKRLFKRRGYVFDVVDVTDDGTRAWLMETTRCEAVPQVFVAGRLVGCFETIKALDRTGDLDRLVRGEA